MINEINYHSADELDTGDWVELYNPNDASVDLSGWNFRDDDDDHSFVLPGGTLIGPRGFLVLCRDGAALESLLGVSCVGDFDFGLRNSGELVRLFDRDGLLVDSVTYQDDNPWPVAADGDGPTLELLHYSLDNADPMQWRASIPMGGTPGRANSVLVLPTSVASETDEGTPQSFNLLQNYPNPFNSETHIAFHLPRTEPLSLEIFSVTGQLVATLMEGVYRAGRHRIALGRPGRSRRVRWFRDILLSVDDGNLAINANHGPRQVMGRVMTGIGYDSHRTKLRHPVRWLTGCWVVLLLLSPAGSQDGSPAPPCVRRSWHR